MFKIYIAIFLLSFWTGLDGFSMLKTSWEFVLPRSALDQIQAIEANDSLSSIGVERAIDQILIQQQDDILSQLEIPSYFSQLPDVARWQIRDVLFHRNLSYAEKQEIIVDFLTRLPPSDRRFPKVDRCKDNLPGAKSMYFDTYSTVTYTVRFTFPLAELAQKLNTMDYKALYNTFRSDNYTIDEKLDQLLEIMTKQPPSIKKALFVSPLPLPEEVVENLFFVNSAGNFKENVPALSQTKKVQQSTPPTPIKKASSTKKPLHGRAVNIGANPKNIKSLFG